MGADKNSSRRMNSAYTPGSQLQIPTRVCQGRVVTTDLPTLGTNPNSIQHGSTTQKGKDIGNLESTRRTVREEGVNHSKLLPEHPVLHREKRTVRDGPADRPPRHGPSANFMHQKSTDKVDRKKGAQELARTRRIARLSGTSRTVRGYLADGLR
jgi:hypothetical protein